MKEDKAKTISKLIKAFRKGNSKALEDLMLATHQDLFWLAFRYTKDKMLAEDMVSETFVKLIEKIHTIKSEQNLSGYMRTIVINKSLNAVRNRKKTAFVDSAVIENESLATEESEDDKLVRVIVGGLGEAEREVLLMWSYGYTLKEICAKTSMTISQVRTLLEKSKESFLKKYRKNEEV